VSDFVAKLLRIGVPYVFAALGGTFSERAGVITLGLEGYLLLGAFGATLAADLSGAASAGYAAGAAAGGVAALLVALLVLPLRADQVTTGVALNLFADGLTRFALKAIYDSSSSSPRVEAFAADGGAGLGATLAHPLVIAMLVALPLSHVAMRRTAFGLRVRAVGEHPEAAASLGVSPVRVRLAAVVLGGLLAGLGGAFLAADQTKFIDGMSRGRGYIALAAIIAGGWRPLAAAGAAMLFALAVTVQYTLSSSYVQIPDWATQMLPSVLALAALVLRTRSSAAKPPSSLGSPLGKRELA
jgi:simple sugar transport system permease protein